MRGEMVVGRIDMAPASHVIPPDRCGGRAQRSRADLMAVAAFSGMLGLTGEDRQPGARPRPPAPGVLPARPETVREAGIRRCRLGGVELTDLVGLAPAIVPMEPLGYPHCLNEDAPDLALSVSLPTRFDLPRRRRPRRQATDSRISLLACSATWVRLAAPSLRMIWRT